MPLNDLLHMVLSFAGGVALFLLGMKLLTDGLKLAAGQTLRTLLKRYTSTMVKGVLAGIMVTALVQSSSAVIFATIGFVNAGVMTLAQAIYVIFGSNVGTTLTGWIVATIGLNVDLQVLSMPMLAAGMGLWLSGENRHRGAWGQVLVGLAIFFLGIDILKDTFDNLGQIFQAETIGKGLAGGLLMVFVGIVLTTLMQSSSASIAIVITAAAGGFIPLELAAYMVIGADIGTTSTAVFAVIGATANARRSAAAHVLYNLVSGVMLIVLLPYYLDLIEFVFTGGLNTATTIAVFHTMKKVTGLVVMLPFVGRLEAWLLTKFIPADNATAPPTRYLDNTVLQTPSLAISALIFELKRTGRKTRSLIKKGLTHAIGVKESESKQYTLLQLHQAIAGFIRQLQRRELPETGENALPNALRVLSYFRESMETAVEISSLKQDIQELNPALIERINVLEANVVQLCHIADSEHPDFKMDDVGALQRDFEANYELAKSSLLYSGSRGKLPMNAMLRWHDYIRGLRRITDQLCKASQYMHNFNELIEHTPGAGPALLEDVQNS